LIKTEKYKFQIRKQTYGVLFFQRVQVPYERLKPESLASRKVVGCEARTQGSEPAKSGTDEQKLYRRHLVGDKRPQQRNVRRLQNLLDVDTAGIG
jgi:hypothetical protein